MDEIEIVEEGNAGEKLLGELLDVGAGERDEAIRFEEVKHALPVEIGDNADMVPEVEAVSEVYTSVDVVLVV